MDLYIQHTFIKKPHQNVNIFVWSPWLWTHSSNTIDAALRFGKVKRNHCSQKSKQNCNVIKTQLMFLFITPKWRHYLLLAWNPLYLQEQREWLSKKSHWGCFPEKYNLFLWFYFIVSLNLFLQNLSTQTERRDQGWEEGQFSWTIPLLPTILIFSDEYFNIEYILVSDLYLTKGWNLGEYWKSKGTFACQKWPAENKLTRLYLWLHEGMIVFIHGDSNSELCLIAYKTYSLTICAISTPTN